MNKKNKEILPDWLDTVLWSKYRDHLDSMDASHSESEERTRLHYLKQFVDHGYDQREIIEQAIQNNAIRFFPPKHKKKEENTMIRELKEPWEQYQDSPLKYCSKGHKTILLSRTFTNPSQLFCVHPFDIGYFAIWYCSKCNELFDVSFDELPPDLKAQHDELSTAWHDHHDLSRQ